MVSADNGTTWGIFNDVAFGGGVVDYTSAADVNYRVHIFGSSGTFSVSNSALVVEWLVVAGGGSGGMHHGGGGGAGGFRTGNAHTLSVGPYTVVVGAGGASVESGSSQNLSASGASGGSSSFGSIETIGGGAGSGYNLVSVNGGSGGGTGGNDGSVSDPAGTVVAHTPITGEKSRTIDGDTNGKQGAHGGQSSSAASGGGGGASQEGYAGASSVAGAGGLGENEVMNMDATLSDHFLDAINVGVEVGGARHFSGGGGGRSGTSGGAGGGGGGTAGASTTATDAPANSGGGGGGVNNDYSAHSGAGGSGIVVIRYAT